MAEDGAGVGVAHRLDVAVAVDGAPWACPVVPEVYSHKPGAVAGGRRGPTVGARPRKSSSDRHGERRPGRAGLACAPGAAVVGGTTAARTDGAAAGDLGEQAGVAARGHDDPRPPSRRPGPPPPWPAASSTPAPGSAPMRSPARKVAGKAGSSPTTISTRSPAPTPRERSPLADHPGGSLQLGVGHASSSPHR